MLLNHQTRTWEATVEGGKSQLWLRHEMATFYESSLLHSFRFTRCSERWDENNNSGRGGVDDDDDARRMFSLCHAIHFGLCNPHNNTSRDSTPHTIDSNWFPLCLHHYLTSSSFSFLSLQFYDLVERDDAAKALLSFRALTVFAPTNQAFQRYPNLNIHILYHMSEFDYRFGSNYP